MKGKMEIKRWMCHENLTGSNIYDPFKVPFKQTKIYEKCKYVLILKLIKNH